MFPSVEAWRESDLILLNWQEIVLLEPFAGKFWQLRANAKSFRHRHATEGTEFAEGIEDWQLTTDNFFSLFLTYPDMPGLADISDY
jgi:hypothetical protein